MYPPNLFGSREVVLGTTLDPRTPAFNVQRACGTSLETVNLIALKIATGQIDSGIAGGSELGEGVGDQPRPADHERGEEQTGGAVQPARPGIGAKPAGRGLGPDPDAAGEINRP